MNKASLILGVCLPLLSACGGTVASSSPQDASVVPACTTTYSADAGQPYHRACDQACPSNGPLTPIACSKDSDCEVDLHCYQGFCSYDQCHTSADCDAGTVCTCYPGEDDFGASQCKPAHCRLDSDCADGMLCSPSGPAICFDLSWNCHTHQDTCLDDLDCDGGICTFSAALGHWSCGAFPHCGG